MSPIIATATTPILGGPRTQLGEVEAWARARITAAKRPAPPHLGAALAALPGDIFDWVAGDSGELWVLVEHTALDTPWPVIELYVYSKDAIQPRTGPQPPD